MLGAVLAAARASAASSTRPHRPDRRTARGSPSRSSRDDSSTRPGSRSSSRTRRTTRSARTGGSVADDASRRRSCPRATRAPSPTCSARATRRAAGTTAAPTSSSPGVDLVNVLAKLAKWSNGKVGMIGASYDGTTANMVAVRGADARGLAAIVAAGGDQPLVRLRLPGRRALLRQLRRADRRGRRHAAGFDFGLARTPPTQARPGERAGPADRPLQPVRVRGPHDVRLRHDAGLHQFWQQRDYRKDAANMRVPVLVTHGWQDYNVKQSEGLDLYEAADQRPRFGSSTCGRAARRPSTRRLRHAVLAKFCDHTLKGVDNGIENEPPVYTAGRTGGDGRRKIATEESRGRRPEHMTTPLAGPLRRCRCPRAGRVRRPLTYTDTRHRWRRARHAGGPRLGGRLALLRQRAAHGARRLAGSAYLDAEITDSATTASSRRASLDVAPDGGDTVISRGH